MTGWWRDFTSFADIFEILFMTKTKNVQRGSVQYEKVVRAWCFAGVEGTLREQPGRLHGQKQEQPWNEGDQLLGHGPAYQQQT